MPQGAPHVHLETCQLLHVIGGAIIAGRAAGAMAAERLVQGPKTGIECWIPEAVAGNGVLGQDVLEGAPGLLPRQVFESVSIACEAAPGATRQSVARPPRTKKWRQG